MRFVKTPVSLQDITEQLDAGGYRKPKEFHDDVMLIFENSRNYNTKESTRVSLHFPTDSSFAVENNVDCALSFLFFFLLGLQKHNETREGVQKVDKTLHGKVEPGQMEKFQRQESQIER